MMDPERIKKLQEAGEKIAEVLGEEIKKVAENLSEDLDELLKVIHTHLGNFINSRNNGHNKPEN